MSSVLGSCFCKAIRFEIEFPTDSCSHCHCESCRRLHGAAFVTWASVPRGQFKFIVGQEKLRRYQSSPVATWGFCGDCGSSFLNEHGAAPEKIYFTLSNVDGPIDRSPKAHFSFEEHVGWLGIGDELPKYRGKSAVVCE